ncbi:RnfABCDGE type electron transport complex subunit D [Halosquirtibacter laminarini]|uniref:RnfABCDGE type electron transport complex subunit D n=1 Tax=Halosquirtibacter laminarini TaxID=3374600 RepID=A0AC61NGB6_9BACT|nr:RnfABCDGE type electron transport complex subunit D [Prolixibacteraceae bacterium]
MKLLTVSPSPHIKGDESVTKIMYGVVISLIPALIASTVFFGWQALLITAVSVASCVLFEYLFQKFLIKGESTIQDGSAIITGLLLAFNVPSSLPIWLVVLGALISIGVGKMTFGGLGQNLFNPVLVGRVFLLISFPVQMTSWTANKTVDAFSGATPLGILKEGIKSGQSVSELLPNLPSNFNLFTGSMSGSLGEISALALLLGGLFMLYKKIITWHIPVAVLGSMFILQGTLYLINPDQFINPLFHILTGGAMLGAIYMATDMVTSPMSTKGQLIYGVAIGILTICIRNFGAYPEGISFAILIMNGVVPLINNYIKPKRFGGKA